MLYRRFSIVTCVIALLGILLSNVIEATREDRRSFATAPGSIQWQQTHQSSDCKINPDVCDAGIIGSQIFANIA